MTRGSTQCAAVSTVCGPITVPVHMLPELEPGRWANTPTTQGSPKSGIPPMIGCSSLAVAGTGASSVNGSAAHAAIEHMDRVNMSVFI
jgi:hypothetical protein